jgi:hypothetical protein
MKIKAMSCLASIVVILGTSAIARADVLTFQFGGQLNSVPASVSSTFSVGETFLASFTFDTDAAATVSGSVSSEYPLMSAQVNIGAYVATGVPHALNGITVENDHAVPPAPTFDQWFARSLFSGLPVGGEVIGFGDVDLEDSITHTALSSTALPATLDLSKFNDKIFNLDFCDSISGVTCFGGGFLLGSITTLTVAPVVAPEPSSLALLVVSALALVGLRRACRRGNG